MQSSKERWNPDCLEHSRDAFGSILPLQFSSLQRGCKSSPGPGQSRILQEMQGGRQRAAVSSQRCQPSSCRAHPCSTHSFLGSLVGREPSLDRGALSRGCSNPGASSCLPAAPLWAFFICSSLGAGRLQVWDIISVNLVLVLDQRHSWNRLCSVVPARQHKQLLSQGGT